MNQITYESPPPPWWRRLLGQGPGKKELREDLQKAVRAANENAAECQALTAELARARAALGARVVVWSRPAKRLGRVDILEAFAEPIDAGLQAAVHQELDDYLQGLLDQVSQAPSASLTADTRLHLAGGIEHLRLFQHQLLELHRKAEREDAEIADEAKK